MKKGRGKTFPLDSPSKVSEGEGEKTSDGKPMIQISCEQHGQVIVIRLEGEFYIESIEYAEKIWGEQVARSPRVIGIDCHDIKFIDSSAIGVMVKFLNAAMKMKIELIFFDLSDTIKNVFKTAKLENFFKIMGRSEFETTYLA